MIIPQTPEHQSKLTRGKRTSVPYTYPEKPSNSSFTGGAQKSNKEPIAAHTTVDASSRKREGCQETKIKAQPCKAREEEAYTIRRR